MPPSPQSLKSGYRPAEYSVQFSLQLFLQVLVLFVFLKFSVELQDDCSAKKSIAHVQQPRQLISRTDQSDKGLKRIRRQAFSLGFNCVSRNDGFQISIG